MKSTLRSSRRQKVVKLLNRKRRPRSRADEILQSLRRKP